jgi:uncharacterized protein YyaL (SSP411 family)
MENRLAQEKSPYLLQHKANPVDWYPWGDEAFARARTEDKPILLSIGYAACHWCHVMAHESFEDETIAALMNELFVNIKVDREERPDVDALYMQALTMMTQHGGWPMTMFLTPKGEPFVGGTYFPPVERYGAPAFPHVLRTVAKLYAESRDKVTQNVSAVAQALERASQVQPKRHAGLYDLGQLDALARDALQMLDEERGGFDGAPKFPQPVLYQFLWRTYRRSGNAAVGMAVTTLLTHISQGGIYDHLGGGYARYSTDAEWLAPHFEKMLYDNAQILELLGLVWASTGNQLFELRLLETVAWSVRELATRDGVFAGTLDADSEGEEGKFYVWTEAEVDAVLGADAAAFKRIYDVSAGGNWEGHTILNRLHHLSLGSDEEEAALAAARKKLLAARAKRIRPALDDKILADWNGMMIAALATTGAVVGEASWRNLAEGAYRFIKTHMMAAGRFRHAWRDGQAVERDVLDDYAQMIRAALALYQVSSESAYLDDAIAWTKTCDAHFWDTTGGGYFLAADDAKDLVARTRSGFDNATPSGNGTMAENLARLYYLTGDESWRERAATVIDVFARIPPEHYINMPGILNAFGLLAGAVQVVVIGPAETRDELVQAAYRAGEPNLVLLQLDPDTALPDGHAASGKTMVNGGATAYVCRGQTCGLPQTTTDGLKREVAGR